MDINIINLLIKMNKNDKINKRNISPSNKKDDKNIKKPLFKIFMDENNKKKLHLIKNNINNSKDKQYEENRSNNNNKPLNLQLFSFRILEAKYNSTPELYLKKILNILIKKKKSHLLAYFNELYIVNGTLREYLKRFYNYKEVKERIPKYVSYYKNYLTFFCRPFFVNYSLNQKMVKHMEKVAQIFYNDNYADEDKEEEEENKRKKENKYIQIFSKKITQDIENCDICTVVTSEAAMKQIQIINNKINKKIFLKAKKEKNEKRKDEINNIKNKNKIENNNNNKDNNINPIEIEQLTIIDNDYKITPICFNDEFMDNKKMKIISELKNKEIKIPQTTNSINLLIDELDKKENNNKNIIDKEKEIINKINNGCIVIQGGKTTNNINININHITIGQKFENDNNKIINGLASLKNNLNNNNNKKIIRKLKSNSNIKDKNENNENIIQYNKEKQKNSLTLPPPSKNIISNNTLNKNYKKINPNTINNYNIKHIKETRNKSLLKNEYNNNGSITSINKYIKIGKGNISNEQLFGKATIYTNNSNYLKNIFNFKNYDTIKISKNNIINIKNNGILSGERIRSISNMQKRPKKIINYSLHFNGGNIQLLNLKNNFVTNKNSDNILNNHINKGIIDYKINNEKIPNIKKLEDFRNNKVLKIKDLNLKGKYLNLQKIINIAPKKSRNRSTGK